MRYVLPSREGEPTLRGLDFFREVIRLEKRFNRRGIRVINTIQTNGFALDEEWCRFFKEHDFLIGLSVDGTQEIHDRYRHDASGGATYARVKKAADLLDSFGVAYNILTVVTRACRNIPGRYTENTKTTDGITSSISPVLIRRGRAGRQGILADAGSLRKVSDRAVPVMGKGLEKGQGAVYPPV